MPSNHQILLELESAQESLDAAHERVVAAQQLLTSAQAESDAAQNRLALAYAAFFRAMQEARQSDDAAPAPEQPVSPAVSALDFSTFLDDAVSGDAARQAKAREQLAALGATLASYGIHLDPEKLAQTPARMRAAHHAPEEETRRTEALDVLQALSTQAEKLAAELAASAEASPPKSPFEQLGRFLEADGWHPQRLAERPVYQMTFDGDYGRVDCFAQVEDDMEQLLFYVQAPVKAPEERRAAVAEFITRANYGLRIGDFEFDYSDGEVRYKSSVDFASIGLTTGLLRDTIYPAVNTLGRYLPGLMGVIYGNQTPAEAIAEIES